MRAPVPSDEALRSALASSGAALHEGLTEQELAAVEARFVFRFPPDLRRLLTLSLPLGEPDWPDWRSESHESLAARLAWPVEGILFDVEENAFWHPAWPERPRTKAAAVELARAELSSTPRLIPLYGHRYLPSVPSLAGSPVLSVYQTDIVHYGVDLLDWFDREFHRSSAEREPSVVPFWSELMGLDEGDSHQFW